MGKNSQERLKNSKNIWLNNLKNDYQIYSK